MPNIRLVAKIALAVLAVNAVTSTARANDVGAVVYTQPWVPQSYAQDHVVPIVSN